MKMTIEMPDSVSWSSRDIDFTLELSKIEPTKLADLIAQAAVMGFKKAGVDAAAGAKEYAKKNGLPESVATTELTMKKIAVWESGDWGATRGGDGMTRTERYAVSLCREAVKAREAKAYKDWDEKTRFAECEAYFAGLDEAKRDGLLAHAAKMIAIADKAKAERDALELDIKL
jgi:hypothetical protein